jgi:CheY-like chemotaxis protein
MSHVLILDSDKRLRDTYVAALEAAGHSVVGAASAQASIGACEDRQPDLILLELQLRGHSGVEFLHEFRSYPEWQKIPVVLHTMVPWNELKGFDHAFETLGITGYAYKPETTLKKLISLVNNSSPVSS